MKIYIVIIILYALSSCNSPKDIKPDVKNGNDLINIKIENDKFKNKLIDVPLSNWRQIALVSHILLHKLEENHIVHQAGVHVGQMIVGNFMNLIYNKTINNKIQ